MADLGDRGDVDHVVQGPVPAARQPPDRVLRVPGGPLDRGGAVVGGEAIRGREPGDVADVAEDDRGADVTDPEDLGEGRPRRRDRDADALAERLALAC